MPFGLHFVSTRRCWSIPSHGLLQLTLVPGFLLAWGASFGLRTRLRGHRMDGEFLLFLSPLETGAGVSGTRGPTVACSQAWGGCNGNLVSPSRGPHKREADLARRAPVGRPPCSTWGLNFSFKDGPPTGPLSFSFPVICHYDYIHMSQRLGGDVRMFQMAASLVKVRYE